MEERAYPTATLKHLASRRALASVVEAHGEPADRALLEALLAAPEGLDLARIRPALLSALCRAHLAVRTTFRPSAEPSPWRNVSVLNFELTYGCNLRCGHCHQAALRSPGEYAFLSFAVVTQALADGTWLGLTREGVNFTGGEVFVPGSPVLGSIRVAAELGCRVRCNTNAHWGRRKNIQVGHRTFSTDEALVQALREIGLCTLALSLDARYLQYPNLLEAVQRVAMLCERAGLGYEFVATDADPQLVETVFDRLRQFADGELVHLQVRPRKRRKLPGVRDTTDLGAAASPDDVGLDPDGLPALVERAACAKKGFTRPQYLHVNPAGGVRSCLLAPGSASFGTLGPERLPQLLNRAAEQPVVRLFAEGDIAAFVARRIAPFRRLYRQITHPCAASALVARVAAELMDHVESFGRDLTGDEELALHVALARSWNLAAARGGDRHAAR